MFVAHYEARAKKNRGGTMKINININIFFSVSYITTSIYDYANMKA